MEPIEKLVISLSSSMAVLVLIATVILIKKLKFGSKNHVLLFVLFIVYWMAPLMTREYTGQMHIHMGIGDGGAMLWIPLTVYGIAGLFWRPLTDILSFKLQSRKKVIYFSLLVQALTLWPMFFWPNFTTNIIQSIGTGVGASCIGLFNLMFDEQHHKKKIFTTVSILVLPPLIAEFFTSCLESVICTCVPIHDARGTFAPPTIYLDYLKWVWLIATCFVIISFVLTKLFKEDRQLIFKEMIVKEPVTTKHDKSVVWLVCLAGLCFVFMRWITAGPSSVTQLIYISKSDVFNPTTATEREVEVKFFEGYLSLLFAFGQLVGSIIAGLILNKHTNRSKYLLVSAGTLIWLLYLLTNSFVYYNCHVFFWTNAINGIGYGLIYPVLIGIMLNKFFVRTKIITPIGLFNTSMALGIVVASVFNNVLKGAIYDFHYTRETSTISYFQRDNWIVNGTTMCVVVLMLVLFVVSYYIHIKYPPQQIKTGVRYVSTGETEI